MKKTFIPLIAKSLVSLMVAMGLSNAFAQAKKEVTFAHQDMQLPHRILMDAGLEKATGYIINWRMFDGGDEVIKAISKEDADYRAHAAKWTVGLPQVKAIARWTKADEKDVPDAMAAFALPDPATQMSSAWMGGGTAGGAARTLENSAKL